MILKKLVLSDYVELTNRQAKFILGGYGDYDDYTDRWCSYKNDVCGGNCGGDASYTCREDTLVGGQVICGCSKPSKPSS